LRGCCWRAGCGFASQSCRHTEQRGGAPSLT
jgi:hypothetical protein